MRYRARVIPLYEGHRQIEKATWEYTDASSKAQAIRFLSKRFPYPRFVIEEPIEDSREETHEEKMARQEAQLKGGEELLDKGKKMLGNPIKEGCFILALALMRIAHASELTAWASNKNRPDEVIDALNATNHEATAAAAIGYITDEQLARIRENANLVYSTYDEKREYDKKEEIQDALADITAAAHEIAFEALVKCQCGEEFISEMQVSGKMRTPEEQLLEALFGNLTEAKSKYLAWQLPQIVSGKLTIDEARRLFKKKFPNTKWEV